MTRARKNKRQQILDLLINAHGGWVSAVDLGRIALQYCARLAEARALGFDIENRIERVDGKAHGFYRIRLGMPRPVERREIPTKPRSQPTLFDMGQRHLDLG